MSFNFVFLDQQGIKQEDLKARLDKRRQVVVGPIYQDVMKALQEFAVKNGYAVILDGAKLEEAQILSSLNQYPNFASSNMNQLQNFVARVSELP